MKGWHTAGVGICLGLVLAVPAAGSTSDDGQVLFEKRCVACHQLPDIDNPPPEGWEKRLQLMAPLAKLKAAQQEAVLGYLTTHQHDTVTSASLEEDKAFFEQKCSGCHTLDRIFLEPLTEESMRHVVQRVRAMTGTDWISDEDVERVMNYLYSAKRDVPTPPTLAADASAEEIFTARCKACHTMERIVTHLDPNDERVMDWSHVVGRMRGKAPQWITDAESRQIIDYLQSLSTPGKGG